jgi:glycosyltransferase A (GT-A) superfamily protein (DUF2064 family)
MDDFFRTSFAGGAQQVVLIGSDSPTLPRDFIQQAFDELRRHEVVLGPTDDGGYYLIGLSRGTWPRLTETQVRVSERLAHVTSEPYRVPPIFDDMPWSTPQVWPETIRRLDERGHSYAILPAWYDVDEPRDLKRLRDELLRTTDEYLRDLKETVEAIVA